MNIVMQPAIAVQEYIRRGEAEKCLSSLYECIEGKHSRKVLLYW